MASNQLLIFHFFFAKYQRLMATKVARQIYSILLNEECLNILLGCSAIVLRRFKENLNRIEMNLDTKPFRRRIDSTEPIQI